MGVLRYPLRYPFNSNRLIDISGSPILLDANGNTLDDGTRQYHYDSLNRLIGVGNSITYGYNALTKPLRVAPRGASMVLTVNCWRNMGRTSPA